MYTSLRCACQKLMNKVRKKWQTFCDKQKHTQASKYLNKWKTRRARAFVRCVLTIWYAKNYSSSQNMLMRRNILWSLYYASPYVMPFIAKWYLIESESLRVFELSLKIKSFGLRLTQHCLLVNFFLLNSWKMSFFKDVVHIYLNNSSLWLLNAETWFFARLYYCIIFYFGELFIEEPKQSHTHRL